MYPIRFEPICKDYEWGGESWELVDREDAMSVVANGPLKGKTLHQLVVDMGEELLGIGQKWDRFPLILKVTEAKKNLSVQVHPDEVTASRLKGEAKSEMWILLKEGSVCAALKKGVDEKQFRSAITKGNAHELLEKWDLKRGEAVYVPGGRVHAICEGALLFGVQQNSNTTYRLYDWGRKGRELQLEEGFASIHWGDQGHVKIAPHRLSSDLHHQLITLTGSPFFIVDRVDVFDRHHVAAIPKTFQVFFCIEGNGHLLVDSQKEPFQAGMTYLIPASCKSINVEGRCQFLRVRLP